MEKGATGGRPCARSNNHAAAWLEVALALVAQLHQAEK